MELFAVNPLNYSLDSVLIQVSLGTQRSFFCALSRSISFINHVFQFLARCINVLWCLWSLEMGCCSFPYSLVSCLNQYCDFGEIRHISVNVGYLWKISCGSPINVTLFSLCRTNIGFKSCHMFYLCAGLQIGVEFCRPSLPVSTALFLTKLFLYLSTSYIFMTKSTNAVVFLESANQ